MQEKLREYERTELSPDVCKNYKTFEDEVIASGKDFNHILELLKMEKQGLLLRLPYKVGTPLYFAFKNKGVVQDRIRRWQINKDGLFFCSKGCAYIPDAIGKSVFLTREEAENRLNELKCE